MIDLSLKSLNDSKMDINGVTTSSTNGNIKINNVETTVYTHPNTHASSMITGLSTVAATGAANDLSFSNANFTSTNVSAALNELFTNVSNGKNSIASAITDKGISASGNDSFTTLSTKISSISTGSGNAIASDVLAGKTFTNGTASGLIGTMTNNGGAVTVTPTTSNIIKPAGYYSGAITILGDSDLTTSNIVSGKSIFGVTGTASKRVPFTDGYVNSTITALPVVSYIEGEGVWISDSTNGGASLVNTAGTVIRNVKCASYSGATIVSVSKDRMAWYYASGNTMYITDKNGAAILTKPLGTYRSPSGILLDSGNDRIYTMQDNGSSRFALVYNFAGTQIGSTVSIGSASFKFLGLISAGAIYHSSYTSSPFGLGLITSSGTAGIAPTFEFFHYSLI